MNQDSLEIGRILKPGQIISPDVSISTATALIQEHFGYTVKRITELNSYDDKNFFVETSETVQGDDKTKKFVFKVLNSMDSTKQHYEAENAVMMFLRSKGISCPVPETSCQEGSSCPLIEIPSRKDIDNNEPGGDCEPSTRSHVIRLLSFVEGQILAAIRVSPQMLYDVGEYAGDLLTTLESFDHPGLHNHDSIWFLTSTPYLRQFLYVIQSEPDKFKMVSEVLTAFTERVVPAYPNLRKGIIHGDLNEQNIIVGEIDPAQVLQRKTNRTHVITGVIDFGDLQNTYYIFEVAVLLAYMMVECVKSDMDPLEGSAHVLAGLSSKRLIPQQELDILRICICSRLCQSVVLGRYSFTLDPTNDYLLTTAKNGWNLLDKLWNQTTDEQLLSIWKEITAQL